MYGRQGCSCVADMDVHVQQTDLDIVAMDGVLERRKQGHNSTVPD